MENIAKTDFYCWITGKPRETRERISLNSLSIWEPDAQIAAETYAERIGIEDTITVTVMDHQGEPTVWEVSPIAETRYTARRRRGGARV